MDLKKIEKELIKETNHATRKHGILDPYWEDKIRQLIAKVEELEETQRKRIASDLIEAKSEDAKLLARVGGLKTVIGWVRNNKVFKVERLFKDDEREIERLISHLDLAISAGREGWKKAEQNEALILELKEAIGKVLAWRNFDGDGISDPLRKELYAHLKEG